MLRLYLTLNIVSMFFTRLCFLVLALRLFAPCHFINKPSWCHHNFINIRNDLRKSGLVLNVSTLT